MQHKHKATMEETLPPLLANLHLTKFCQTESKTKEPEKSVGSNTTRKTTHHGVSNGREVVEQKVDVQCSIGCRARRGAKSN